MPDEPFEEMTKAQLQAEARMRGLPDGGSREQLLDLLQGERGGAADADVDDEADHDAATPEDEGGSPLPDDRDDQAAADDTPEDGDESTTEDDDDGDAGDDGGDNDDDQVVAVDEDAGHEDEEPPEEAFGPLPGAEEMGRSREDVQAEQDAEGAQEPEARGDGGDGDDSDLHEGEPSEETAMSDEDQDHAGGDEPNAQTGVPERDPQPAGENGRGRLSSIIKTARASLESLTGRRIETISGTEPTDGGYHITVEVVEVARIPSTTDVLATYEVDTDDGGDVISFAKTARYYRNQRSEE